VGKRPGENAVFQLEFGKRGREKRTGSPWGPCPEGRRGGKKPLACLSLLTKEKKNGALLTER